MEDTDKKSRMWKAFLDLQTFTDTLSKSSVTRQKLLNKLKGKKEWKWGEEHQKAFKKLKKKINESTSPFATKKRRKSLE